jgi:hypothetical protein
MNNIHEITCEMNEAAVILAVFDLAKAHGGPVMGSEEKREAYDRVVARARETVARCLAQIAAVQERKKYDARLQAHLKRYPRGERRFRG